MKQYELLLADPPWKQAKGGRKRVRANSSGGQLDYSTLTLMEIEDILGDASKLGTDSHVFFLWAIDKHLHASEGIMERLGYKLHARMVWNKVTGIPAAFTIRYGHEYLLYYYRGKLPPVALHERGKIHTVFTERVTKHSKKPEVSYEIMERLYPTASKLELFARTTRKGWDVWGDQIKSSVKVLTWD